MRILSVVILVLTLSACSHSTTSEKTYSDSQYQEAMKKSYQDGYKDGFSEGKKEVVSDAPGQDTDKLTEESNGSDWGKASQYQREKFLKSLSEDGLFLSGTLANNSIEIIDDYYSSHPKSKKLKDAAAEIKKILNK